jgi:hypothetical protein
MSLKLSKITLNFFSISLLSFEANSFLIKKIQLKTIEIYFEKNSLIITFFLF